MDFKQEQELQEMLNDPVFQEIFVLMYRRYKLVDREFDKKTVDKDIHNLLKKLETINQARQQRKCRQ